MSYFFTKAFIDGFQGKPYIRTMSSIVDNEYAREYGRGEYARYYREMLLRFGSPPCGTCGARAKNQDFKKEEVL